ncbi:MAG: hypothetical protein Q7K35_04990 [bacterium]|nr:hypothetical protein [bacterium]
MPIDKGFEKIGDLFNLKSKKSSLKDSVIKSKRLPAYIWQDLALRVINELGIPNFKRGSVFKVCKLNSRIFIEKCLNDTKELCQSGEPWKYFFKIIGGKGGKL